MRIARLLSIALLALAAGCGVQTTEAIEMNGAGITDGTGIMVDALKQAKEGTATPEQLDEAIKVGEQVHRNAQTNEQILGSPKHQIDPHDTDAMEKNRTQAQADAEDGGFWTKFTSSSLGFMGVVASLFGMGAAGEWLTKRSKQVRTVQKKLKDTEATARKYAGYFSTTVNGVQRYLGKGKGAGVGALLKELGAEADASGDREGHDAAVAEILKAEG